MDDAHAEYLRDIEQRFVALRGRGFMLSPRDLSIVERWYGQGIPLRIVLRALEDGVKVFIDKNLSGTPLPSSLAYFENQVDKAAVLWRERTMSWGLSGSGDNEGSLGPDREALLQAAMEAVAEAGEESGDEAIKEIVRATWRSLRQARDQGDIEPCALIEALDSAMVENAEKTIDDEAMMVLQEQVEESMVKRATGNMSAEAWAKRARLVLIEEVRSHCGLPDLVEVLDNVRL